MGARRESGRAPLLELRRQERVVADRYLETLLGDWPTLLLMLGQAPAIGALCAVVWGGVRHDTRSLYFVLALSAVWFGCINACREIVKERKLFERERLAGLVPTAYVLAKAHVLVLVGLLQVACLLAIVEWRVGLRGSLVWQALALVLCNAAGTSLGLLTSALVQRQDRAVAAVPLLILPQILFSEFAIPRSYFSSTVEVIENLMMVKWGYRIFVEAASADVNAATIFGCALVLLCMTAVLLVLASLALRLASPGDFL